MLKAIFLDHMGTIVNENSKYMHSLIKTCVENSDTENEKQMEKYWFTKNEELLQKYNGENFKTKYEIALETFEIAKKEVGLLGDSKKHMDILTKHWMCSPAYEDALAFFEKCPLPVYVVTNSDDEYIKKSMEFLGLTPKEIVSSQRTGYYKPRKEIFEKALEISSVSAEEVLHIGNSMHIDIKGASAAGIRPILLNRTGEDIGNTVATVDLLIEVLGIIEKDS